MNLQLGIVLALGGHSNQYYDYGPAGSLNGLMSVWDSWVDNFFSRVSNSTSIVLLFDERDFRRQNYTRSISQYIDSIVINNMGGRPADCVHLRSSTRNFPAAASPGGRGPASRQHRNAGRRPRPAVCSSLNNTLDLDQGYKVFYLDTRNPNSTHQQPFIVFAGVHTFSPPDWARGMDEEMLFIHWRPGRMGRFKTNYGYVKMTNWYSYHMLNLRLLDYFDYAGKLDNDVSFVAPFPETNLPLKLAARGTRMLVSANGWYFDEPRVAQGIRQCLNTFVQDESKRCSADGPDKNLFRQLVPGGSNASLFWESNLNATFRAHFLVFWLGLYAAPETKAMARHWNDWNPRGMWDYRWGDQQWWPRPIAVFGEGSLDREIDHFDAINTDNERFVVHKLWPRQATVERTSYFNLSAGTKRADRDARYALAAKGYKY